MLYLIQSKIFSSWRLTISQTRPTTMPGSLPHACIFFVLLLHFFVSFFCSSDAKAVEPPYSSQQQQPLNPSNLTSAGSSASNTVPAFPVVQMENQTCHLDLSNELFGGVGDACGRTLDRSRCCPVLAAWLFAAHARSALELHPAAFQPDSDLTPMMPDDSQKCVDSLQSSLKSRDIYLARPNASCDAVLCFCGIRLHQIGSLRCPAAFNLSATYRNATPTAALKDLEKNCRNSSYSGCTRCLQSLDKLKGGTNGSSNSGVISSDGGDRASRMFGRDCQLMGLTWLLARNKTAYIPTVSAVLRAIMYSAHPPSSEEKRQVTLQTCSPDQENMPLAVDSLQFQKIDTSSSAYVSNNFLFSIFAAVFLPVLFYRPIFTTEQ